MISAILTAISIVLLAVATALQKVFYHVPAVELKRRARRGDDAARQLYKLACYGDSLRIVLWSLIIVSAAVAFILLARELSFWPALVIILFLLWVAFIWFPGTRVAAVELKISAWLARPLAPLLAWLHRPLSNLAVKLGRYRAGFHTGAYELNDLADLLLAQKEQADNRILRESIDVALNGLTFGEKVVEDFMTPRRAVRTVEAEADITPGLIDELHKSGQKLFPVVEGKPEKFVGTLRLDALVDIRKSGRAKNLMEPKVYYVHEDHNLAQVLDAFYKTRHHLYIVVNKFEDFVGVISIEDVIEQIIGKPILSDFDDYSDPQAVASHIARRATGKEPEQEEDLVAEVIE